MAGLQVAGQAIGQQGRLIVSTAEHAGPVQGYGRNERIGRRERPRSMGQPPGRWPHDLLPVAMLERHDQLTTVLVIKHGSASGTPGSGNPETVVAGHPLAVVVTGKRYATQVTGEARYEGRISPARPTEAEFAFHLCPAQDTSGRIDQLQRSLKRNQRRLTF